MSKRDAGRQRVFSRGQLLGEVAAAFRFSTFEGLDSDSDVVIKSDGAKEFFAGGRVKPETERSVVDAFSRILRRHVLESVTPSQDEKPELSPDRMISGIITSLMHEYDSLVHNARDALETGPGADGALYGLARLFAIAIGFRLAALSALGFIKIPERDSLYWMDPKCVPAMIKDQVDRWPSLTKFANEVGVEPSTISRWLSGKHEIGDEHYWSISNAISLRAQREARERGEDWSDQKREIRRNNALRMYRLAHGLASLYQKLATGLGEDRLREVQGMMLWLGKGFREVLIGIRPKTENQDLDWKNELVKTVMIGTGSTEILNLLDRVGRRNLADSQWGPDILAVVAGAQYQRIKLYAATHKIADRLMEPGRTREQTLEILLGSPSKIAELRSRVVSHGVRGTRSLEMESLLLQFQGQAHHSSGEYEEAAKCFRQLVGIKSTAEGLYRLGLSLSETDDKDEALRCLLKASELRSDWPEPIVDAGLVLFSCDQAADARDLLERHSEQFGKISGRYASVLGSVRLATHEFEGAREAFEAALNDEPSDPEALDGMSECLRRLGEALPKGKKRQEYLKRSGELAKQAKEVGLPRMFNELKLKADRRKGH